MVDAGDSWRVALRFTQHDFDVFARLSGDANPIHVDPVFAQGTRFGKTVAHGMLLFGELAAATSRHVGSSFRLAGQDLIFPAPTFAGVPLAAHFHVESSDDAAGITVRQRVETDTGTTTVMGTAVLFRSGVASAPPTAPGAQVSEADQLGHLRLGSTAQKSQAIGPEEVAEWCRLVDGYDPRYRGEHAEVPPPLLGGLVSDLLGTELPGPGTNWLKQTYTFVRPVTVGELVTTSVEIIRLRPDKGLVNLVTRCATPSGIAVTGEALVLVQDRA